MDLRAVLQEVWLLMDVKTLLKWTPQRSFCQKHCVDYRNPVKNTLSSFWVWTFTVTRFADKYKYGAFRGSETVTLGFQNTVIYKNLLTHFNHVRNSTYKRRGPLSRGMPVPLNCLNCYSCSFQLEFTLALAETLKVICNLLCPSGKLFPLHSTQVRPVWSNTVWLSSLTLFPLESPVSLDQMILD